MSSDDLGGNFTLEVLIHEFLCKKRYNGAAKIFRIEANLPINNADPRRFSLLQDWFEAFNDIYNARCGNIRSVENLTRIEGIMLRLDNEKKRHALLGRSTRDNEEENIRFSSVSHEKQYNPDSMRYSHDSSYENSKPDYSLRLKNNNVQNQKYDIPYQQEINNHTNENFNEKKLFDENKNFYFDSNLGYNTKTEINANLGNVSKKQKILPSNSNNEIARLQYKNGNSTNLRSNSVYEPSDNFRARSGSVFDKKELKYKNGYNYNEEQNYHSIKNHENLNTAFPEIYNQYSKNPENYKEQLYAENNINHDSTNKSYKNNERNLFGHNYNKNVEKKNTYDYNLNNYDTLPTKNQEKIYNKGSEVFIKNFDFNAHKNLNIEENSDLNRNLYKLREENHEINYQIKEQNGENSENLNKYVNFNDYDNKYVNSFKNHEFLKLVHAFKLHSQKISCLAIGNLSKIAITGGNDRLLNIINLKNNEHLTSFEPHQKAITDIKIKEIKNKDGFDVLILTSSQNAEVKIFKFDGKSLNQILLFNKHKTSVHCVEFIENNVLSLDVDGELRKWNFDGFCEETLQTKEFKSILVVDKKNLLVSDRSKVFLFDITCNKIIKEILDESAISIKKKFDKYIVCLKDKVVVLDLNFKISNIVNILGEKLQSGCLLADGSVLIGSYQQIHKNGVQGIFNIQAHENVVVCMENTEICDKEIIISCSFDGDCKIWEYVKN
ncbi:hypothetical protein GVAV_002163 [Gurleya vavrai]